MLIHVFLKLHEVPINSPQKNCYGWAEAVACLVKGIVFLCYYAVFFLLVSDSSFVYLSKTTGHVPVSDKLLHVRFPADPEHLPSSECILQLLRPVQMQQDF